MCVVCIELVLFVVALGSGRDAVGRTRRIRCATEHGGGDGCTCKEKKKMSQIQFEFILFFCFVGRTRVCFSTRRSAPRELNSKHRISH
jgi:hypothetical protein